MCTDELSDVTGEPMNQLGLFLGLPSFNFSATVSAGAYNVGGYIGYDNEIPWTVVEQARSNNSTNNKRGDSIPVTEIFRQELDDFIKPYNERLFQLVGRRCEW